MIDKDIREENEHLKEYQHNEYIKFHIFMALYSTYISVYFSNWGNATIDGSHWGTAETSYFPMYIKGLVYLTGAGLYLWTLLAPTIYPEKEF